MCTVFSELFFDTHKREGYSFQKLFFDIHRDGYGLCLLCRNLAELELQENEIDFRSGEWLTSFPETYTSLVSLNFATMRSEVNYVDVVALERLVARCPSLKKLKLNKEISLDQLQRLLLRAGPNLVELGTGSYSQSLSWGQLSELQTTLAKCKDLRSLSVVWEVAPMFVRTLYPVCLHLTTLNLSDVHLPTPDFTKLISHCPKLQRLLVSPFPNSLSLSLSPCMSVSISVSLLSFSSQAFSISNSGFVGTSPLCVHPSCGCARLLPFKCKPFVNVSSLFHISRLLFFFKSQTSSSPSWVLQMSSLCVHHPSHEWHFLPFKWQVLCAHFSSLLHILSRILFTKS